MASRLFDLPTEEVAQQLESIGSVADEAERRAIRERSVALGAIFNHLALARRGATETSITEGRLLDSARRIIGELGLATSVVIKGGLSEEESIQEAHEMATRLKSMRKELRLTQAQFGERYGVSRFTILRAERGVFSSELISKIFPAKSIAAEQ